METEDTQPNGVSYFGQEIILTRLREGLKELRGSVSFNVVGSVGSGKSMLLDYVSQQVKRTEGGWTVRGGTQIEVIRLDGKNFARLGSFIMFFADGLEQHFGERWIDIIDEEHIDLSQDPSSIVYVLSRLTKNDTSLIIIIDNFASIMDRLLYEEAQKLNYLKHARVNYILVTDHRSVSEINKSISSASTFFQEIIEIHLYPLLRNIAEQFIVTTCEALPTKCPLNDNDIEFVQELGGGHPGLLKGTLQLLVYEKPVRHADSEWEKRPLNEINRAVLRLLPQAAVIYYYLNKIAESLTDLTPSEQELLVEIAMGWFGNEKSTVSHIYNPGMRQRFLVRGLIDTENVLAPVISSKLIQYTILQNLTDVKFSEAEETVFNLIREKRPSLASFEDLDAGLEQFMPGDVKEKSAETNRDPRRRFIDSTMIRVRKKLDEASNKAAFAIENERGRGFYMYSQVTFDEFYEHGPEVFTRMKGPTR